MLDLPDFDKRRGMDEANINVPRTTTGVPGLDEILGGGLPERRLYSVEGSAGTGKTTLAFQFLLEGASRGEQALFVSFSESEDELRSVADSHGWSLDGGADLLRAEFRRRKLGS